MLKQVIRAFAYLLLVLMPIQSIAAANMSVCNGIKQSPHLQLSDSQQKSEAMPCHQHLSKNVADSNATHKASCKSSCNTLCASLCAMTALSNHQQSIKFSGQHVIGSLSEQVYASVTLPSLQRPPIFLS